MYSKKQLTKAINDIDPIKLIEPGLNDDEYRHEIDEIYRIDKALGGSKSVGELAVIIHEVFKQGFNYVCDETGNLVFRGDTTGPHELYELVAMKTLSGANHA